MSLGGGVGHGLVLEPEQTLARGLDHILWNPSQGGDLEAVALACRPLFDLMHEDDFFAMFDRIEMYVCNPGDLFWKRCELEIMGCEQRQRAYFTG